MSRIDHRQTIANNTNIKRKITRKDIQESMVQLSRLQNVEKKLAIAKKALEVIATSDEYDVDYSSAIESIEIAREALKKLGTKR